MLVAARPSGLNASAGQSESGCGRVGMLVAVRPSVLSREV